MIDIWTSNSWNTQDKQGSWNAIVIFQYKKQGELICSNLRGSIKNTTSNQLEFTAIIESLKKISGTHFNEHIRVFSTNKYVVDSLIKAAGNNVFKVTKNEDLIKEIMILSEVFKKVEFVQIEKGKYFWSEKSKNISKKKNRHDHKHKFISR